MNRFLDGKQAYLRAFQRADIPKWHAWFNSQEVTEHMNKGAFPTTEPGQEQRFNNLIASRNDIQLAIALKADDRLVGTVGIHKIDWVQRRGELSIVIGETECWGKGIATEAISLLTGHAFGKMNLHRITAGVSSLSTAARRSFEKAGFVLEGTLREHLFHNGSYVDTYYLAILKEDWERARAGAPPSSRGRTSRGRKK